MKKRLLISSVLMSAVLACALGTGTYAWYTASGGSESYTPATSGQIGTYTGDYSTEGFVIAATIGAMADDIVLTDNNGLTWYYVGDTLKQDTTENLKTTASTNVGVTITYSGEGLTDAEVKAAWEVLDIDSITLTVSKTERIKIADDAATAAKTGEDVSFNLNVSDISFSSGVYTNANVGTVHYGVSGLTEEEVENNSVGTISVTVAETA